MKAFRPRLQSLIVELTQACNHACLHCYNVWRGPQQPPYPRGELDTRRTLDMLTLALDQTACAHVTLTGGEPLLRPDIYEILDHLGRRRVQVTLISNGRLIDEDTARRLVAGGVSLFELPLLSHERATHDHLSGVPGAWDAVLAAMANLRLQRGRVVASFVATRKNLEDLPATLRLAFAFGASGFMLNRFNPGGRGREHLADLLPSIAQVRHALEQAEALSQAYGLPVSCSIPIQPCLIDTRDFQHLGFGFCAAGSERAYYTLDPLGNLRPCNHSTTILGNLFEEPFAALIAPERMSTFTGSTPRSCAACARLSECQGGCKAAAQVCYGSLLEEEPFLRQRLRQPGEVAPAA